MCWIRNYKSRKHLESFIMMVKSFCPASGLWYFQRSKDHADLWGSHESIYRRWLPKYHDHWLSYATNELLIYQEKKEYYQFGLDNALGNINFIDKRDTAYPTMLELLVAASKMIEKLSSSELKTQIFQSSKEFNVVKDRINSVMRKRVQHEITTGVMFPEFAQFFKQPNTISYGFLLDMTVLEWESMMLNISCQD